jgi:hypothetical protein
MERCDRRHTKGTHEVEDMSPVLPAPDPVLVLDRHEVDTAADRHGDGPVIRALIPPDPVMDRDGMRGAPARGQQGDDLMVA